MDLNIIIYIFFGLLPSLVWLFYYLTKDLHPEPKRMIIKIFLWGAMITLPVFFVQIGFTSLLGMFDISKTVSAFIYWFLIIAFSEEIFKYLVVKMKVINSPHLDEPVDIMIYMVVAALGFAAIENILYLFSPTGQLSFDQLINRTLLIALIRFVGATFLHTLCAAVVGYGIAVSFFDQKNGWSEVTLGVIIAVALHGLYDFSIMTLDGNIKFVIPVIILLSLAFFVFNRFEKLKKMKGITRLNINLKNK